jgi:WD40 repeat protein
VPALTKPNRRALPDTGQSSKEEAPADSRLQQQTAAEDYKTRDEPRSEGQKPDRRKNDSSRRKRDGSSPVTTKADGFGLIPSKNGNALVAYYLGVFALIPGLALFLGPSALVMGILGKRYASANPQAKGAIHAVAGLILGLLTFVGNIAALVYLFALGGWNKIISIERPDELVQTVLEAGFRPNMEPVDPLTSSLPPDPAVFDPKPQPAPPVQAAEPLFSTNRDFVNPGRRVQSPADPAVLATIRISDAAIEDLAFSQNGKTLAVMGERGSCLLNMETSEFRPTRDGVHLKAVSPDKRWLVALQNQWVAAVYDTATGQLNRDVNLQQLSWPPGQTQQLLAASFSQDGKLLVTALSGTEQGLIIWDTSTWRKTPLAFRTLAQSGQWLAISPDGKSLAFPHSRVPTDPFSADIVIWDIVGNREKARLKTQEVGLNFIECLAFSSDGKFLAAGGHIVSPEARAGMPAKSPLTDPDVIQLWSLDQNRPTRTLKGQYVQLDQRTSTFHPPGKMVFTPDGKILAGLGFDGTLRLWDVSTGKSLAAEDKSSPKALAISPDGKILVMGGKGIVVARDLAKMLEPR